MTPGASLEQLGRIGIVAVLRAPDRARCVRAARALMAGGVLGIEVTYSTPDAVGAIADLAATLPDGAVLGAGTVTSPEQAREAVDAGATFLVSPGTTPALAEAMKATGTMCAMGALTPGEVMTVRSMGADIVKLFPASVGGPSLVTALRGPFPDLAIMPTGGVAPTNIGAWRRAGVLAVGAGSDLCPARTMAKGDWDEITDRARVYVRAWQEASA